jgi:hypothetical protein
MAAQPAELLLVQVGSSSTVSKFEGSASVTVCEPARGGVRRLHGRRMAPAGVQHSASTPLTCVISPYGNRNESQTPNSIAKLDIH